MAKFFQRNFAGGIALQIRIFQETFGAGPQPQEKERDESLMDLDVLKRYLSTVRRLAKKYGDGPTDIEAAIEYQTHEGEVWYQTHDGGEVRLRQDMKEPEDPKRPKTYAEVVQLPNGSTQEFPNFVALEQAARENGWVVIDDDKKVVVGEPIKPIVNMLLKDPRIDPETLTIKEKKEGQ